MPPSIFTDRHQAFIRFLAAARKEVGLTQVELAMRLGNAQSYVSKVERGERRIDVIEFCQIAEALGCDPEDLLREFLELH